jgi:hypothetical protein
MTSTSPSRAAHYRTLALNAYEAARVIEDSVNKRIMQRVALGYENLAAHAETLERTAELVASILAPTEKSL